MMIMNLWQSYDHLPRSTPPALRLAPISHPVCLINSWSTYGYMTLCVVLDSPIFLRLESPLTITSWRRYAHLNSDQDLPGVRVPSGVYARTYATPKSVRCYPLHVDHYITTKTHAHAICGPFPEPPFGAFQINPLMTAPKKHSDMRRDILDLSHPDGASVNSGIPRQSYLGVSYTQSP